MLSKSEKSLGAAGVIALGLIYSCSGEEDKRTVSSEGSSNQVERRETGKKKSGTDRPEITEEAQELGDLVKEYRACMEKPLTDIAEPINLNVSCRENSFKDANKREMGVEVTCHARNEKGTVVSYITSYLGEANVEDYDEDEFGTPEETTQVAYAGSSMDTITDMDTLRSQFVDDYRQAEYQVPYFNFQYESIGGGEFLLDRESIFGATTVRNVAHFEILPSGLEADRALSMCGDARAYLASIPAEDRVVELTEVVEDLANSLGLDRGDIEVMPASERTIVDTQAGFLVNLEGGSETFACVATGSVLRPIDDAELFCVRFEKQITPSGQTNSNLRSFSETIGEVFNDPQAFLEFAAPKE